MMIVGFTGTRRSTEVDAARMRALRKVLMRHRDKTHLEQSEFHHGDCTGMDELAADLARDLGYRVVGHPCNLKGQRAHFPSDWTNKSLPPLERNHNIVKVCDLLVAVPKDPLKEELRSGTWATIRFARSVGKPLVIV